MIVRWTLEQRVAMDLRVEEGARGGKGGLLAVEWPFQSFFWRTFASYAMSAGI